MSKRTASEIRAYCEAATEGPWIAESEPPCWKSLWGQVDSEYDELLTSSNVDNNAAFCINARTDLPAVLDAAVKLRHLATLFGCLAQLIPNADAYLARIEQDLAETAWLEGSEDGST